MVRGSRKTGLNYPARIKRKVLVEHMTEGLQKPKVRGALQGLYVGEMLVCVDLVKVERINQSGSRRFRTKNSIRSSGLNGSTSGLKTRIDS